MYLYGVLAHRQRNIHILGVKIISTQSYVVIAEVSLAVAPLVCVAGPVSGSII